MTNANKNEWEEVLDLEKSKALTPVNHAANLKKAAAALLTNPALQKDNLGELYARAYAQECLHGMMQIARDETIDPKIRHAAYFDIYSIAYGKPASVVKTPNDLGPNLTIDGEIARAGEASQALNLLSEYAHLPPEQWPESLRKLAGIDSD